MHGVFLLVHWGLAEAAPHELFAVVVALVPLVVWSKRVLSVWRINVSYRVVQRL